MFKNKFTNGLILGIVIPLIAFPIIYFFDYSLIHSKSVTVTSNERFLWTGFKTSTLFLIAFCFNLIPTFVANKRYMEEFIRGIMFPTVIYCFIWFFYFKNNFM